MSLFLEPEKGKGFLASVFLSLSLSFLKIIYLFIWLHQVLVAA